MRRTSEHDFRTLGSGTPARVRRPARRTRRRAGTLGPDRGGRPGAVGHDLHATDRRARQRCLADGVQRWHHRGPHGRPGRRGIRHRGGGRMDRRSGTPAHRQTAFPRRGHALPRRPLRRPRRLPPGRRRRRGPLHGRDAPAPGHRGVPAGSDPATARRHPHVRSGRPDGPGGVAHGPHRERREHRSGRSAHRLVR